MLESNISVPGFDLNEKPGEMSLWKKLQLKRKEELEKSQNGFDKLLNKSDDQDLSKIAKQTLILEELKELPIELLQGLISKKEITCL